MIRPDGRGHLLCATLVRRGDDWHGKREPCGNKAKGVLADVAPDSIEAPEPFRLHLLISRLAAELVSHGSTRRSLLSHAEERLRLCAHVHHLAGATRLEHSIVTMGGHL